MNLFELDIISHIFVKIYELAIFTDHSNLIYNDFNLLRLDGVVLGHTLLGVTGLVGVGLGVVGTVGAGSF